MFEDYLMIIYQNLGTRVEVMKKFVAHLSIKVDPILLWKVKNRKEEIDDTKALKDKTEDLI